MDVKLKNFAIALIRKGTFKWKPRQAAYKKAKEKVGCFSTGRPKYKYRCKHCQELFMAKEVVLDHIDPVVPLYGFKSGLEFDFNEYIERMYCGEDNFQVLCGPCHDIKSKEENSIRRKNKKSK